MLPALVHGHAHHHGGMRAAPRGQLAAPDDQVVQEHGADHEHDQRDIDQAAPSAPTTESMSLACVPSAEVHARQRELLRHAFVALAAGGAQVGAVDGGVRIARGQNVVDAVATRAVGGHHRSALRGQPVIAVHVSRDAVAGQPELLRQAHALVAARAGILRQVLFGNRRIGILDVLDGVDPVAIGAHRRQPVAARNSLPVDAGHERLRDLRVALAAGGRHVELVDRRTSSLAARISCAPWQSVQTAAFCEPFSMARPCTLSW